MDLAKKLDEAVKNVKQSEDRRLEYMSIYANAADERELGDYSRLVNQVRYNNGLLSDELLVKFMRISERLLDIIRKVLGDHPEWDDEEVAEEVMIQEDEIEEV